jgi:hypothetical protein
MFFEPYQIDGYASCENIKQRLKDLQNLDFYPMRPGLPKLKKDHLPLNDYLDLNKVKSFNETLFSDLFKRDDL